VAQRGCKPTFGRCIVSKGVRRRRVCGFCVRQARGSPPLKRAGGEAVVSEKSPATGPWCQGTNVVRTRRFGG
jgi:hypothetical protein